MWNSRSKVDALTPKTTVPWYENQTYFKLKKEINRKGERERYKSRERGERERERGCNRVYFFNVSLIICNECWQDKKKQEKKEKLLILYWRETDFRGCDLYGACQLWYHPSKNTYSLWSFR